MIWPWLTCSVLLWTQHTVKTLPIITCVCLAFSRSTPSSGNTSLSALSFPSSLVLFNNRHGECRNVCGLTWHTYQDELANPPLFPLLQNHRALCHQIFCVPPPNTIMCTETVPIQVLDYCSFPTAHTHGYGSKQCSLVPQSICIVLSLALTAKGGFLNLASALTMSLSWGEQLNNPHRPTWYSSKIGEYWIGRSLPDAYCTQNWPTVGVDRLSVIFKVIGMGHFQNRFAD